ncbi:hypothetical protein [Allosphingosinicella indica]|uniref:Uncharacterized protein n=1 Tax=Allosphingosinicella indica TaxID=941907 RepID=A0A1X7FYX0_9SPHN|nr:hypothetical protein [Allosphingosinicella indica]SMF61295.1 hypothetical protein SAMN06295910_0280 [Allosphingosinicella indica]
MFKTTAAGAALSLLALAGCSSDGQIQATGITVTRSACPAVAIPAATGDVTLFNPPTSRDASAIDVVANISNLRATCDESGEYVQSNLTFEVSGRRSDASGAREVVLPYFSTVVQGGSNVIAKRLGRVALRFEDGQLRASTTATANAQVLRSAATLPEDIRKQVTRERKPGDADAALDPLSDPAVRVAVQRATFEVLVGFQLTEDQLRYNATR